MKKQEEEFKLNEKIDYIGDNFGFPIKAVKEFIRLLKKGLKKDAVIDIGGIDKLKINYLQVSLRLINKLSGGL